MRREPSIHIKESDLIKVLEEAEVTGNIPQLVKFILSKARKYSLNHRSLLAGNAKVAKKAEKVLSSSVEDTQHMVRSIYFIRRQLRHRNITLPKPGESQYSLIKTITVNAIKFYEEYYEVTEAKSDAFVEYIRIGCSKMTSFALPKLVAMHESICKTYEAQTLIAQNENLDLTDRALRTYNKFVVDKVGSILQDYSKMPDKYMYFIMVAKRCKELGLPPETYIEAQFKGVEWRGGIPDPAQLINGKSLEYLQKFLYENPDKATTKKQTGLANKFKALLNGNSDNKE